MLDQTTNIIFDDTTLFLTFVAMLLLSVGAVGYIFYPAFQAWRRPRGLAARMQSIPATQNNDNDNKPVLLSLVIPAYNEEERLPTMLDAAYSYLSANPTCPALDMLKEAYQKSNDNNNVDEIGTMVEWIVVNDGSSDNTAQVYEDYATRKQQNKANTKMAWRLFTLSQNSGKGAAVQSGMMRARGHYRLMVDADGATDFGPGLEAVAQHSKDYDFVFGIRSDQNGDDSAVQRSLVRQILQAGFHAFVVLVVGNKDVKDTQCGFKLFAGPTALRLFRGLHLHGWAFDTELFVRAGLLNVKPKEVHVPWQEIEGSKLNTSTLNLIKVAISMLRDMVCVRLCYTLRIWTIGEHNNSSNAAKKQQ